MLGCVTLCLCTHAYVLHGIGKCGMKKMSWCWHCLMTLSLVVSLGVITGKRETRKEEESGCTHDAVVLQESWFFFSCYARVQKVENMCLLLWWYREFFTLWLIRESEGERRGKAEGCRESEERSVCVCVFLCSTGWLVSYSSLLCW